jgi:hypothetical protein
VYIVACVYIDPEILPIHLSCTFRTMNVIRNEDILKPRCYFISFAVEKKTIIDRRKIVDWFREDDDCARVAQSIFTVTGFTFVTSQIVCSPPLQSTPSLFPLFPMYQKSLLYRCKSLRYIGKRGKAKKSTEKGAKNTYMAIGNAPKNARKMSRNGSITKIVKTRTSRRIIKNTFGILKRDERTTFFYN